MRLWPWKRGRPDRIRRDAGELTPDDLERFAVWEFALDEEGIEGQTECTVRPVDPTPWPDVFDVIVAATLTASSGQTYHGGVHANSFAIREARSPAGLDTWIVRSDGSGCHFSLGAEHFVSDAQARPKIAAAYATLQIDGPRLFPITVRPKVRIPGLPESWELPGFMRAPHPSNRNPFLR